MIVWPVMSGVDDEEELPPPASRDPVDLTGLPGAVLYYTLRMPLRPRRAAKELSEDRRRLLVAVISYLALGLAYAVTVLVAYLGGTVAVIDPWLPIAAERYVLWESLFALPGLFTLLVFMSVVIHLALRRLGGHGAYDEAFVVLALSHVMPMVLLMWLPETVLMGVGTALRDELLGGWLDLSRRLAVPAWSAIVASAALSETHRVTRARALAAVLAGMVPATLIVVAVVR